MVAVLDKIADLLHQLIDTRLTTESGQSGRREGGLPGKMSSQSRPRTGTEEAAAAAAGVASAENAVAPPPNGSGVANQQQAEETQQPFVASTAPLTFTDFLEKMR